MSGFTRIATRTARPRRDPIASSLASSPADSTLIAFTPSATADSSSAGVLPTPVKTICEGSKPALRATSISQTELASTELPRPRNRRAMASAEFAFRA